MLILNLVQASISEFNTYSTKEDSVVICVQMQADAVACNAEDVAFGRCLIRQPAQSLKYGQEAAAAPESVVVIAVHSQSVEQVATML